MKSAIKHGVVLAFAVTGFTMAPSGCLTRPVTSGDPATNTNFTTKVTNQVIDKVDLLFDIDNSASMGDKQSYLIQAIPDLINRLVNPNCVDATGAFVAPSTGGVCTTGQLEFAPIHDLHLGIVTSSLGARLSEPGGGGVCDPGLPAAAPFANISAHNDDQGHLIDRSLTLNGTTAVEGTVAAANPSNYLYWFPAAENVGKNPAGPVTAEPNAGVASDIATVGRVGTAGTLIGDFSSIVAGAGIFGCGIESQLESWYRFLVQPDPYASLQPSNADPTKGPIVQSKDMWVDVDTTILRQRKDFLRPDSLVAVVVLTDENDSEIDVRSLGGSGYAFMRTSFQPPRGTAICLNDPGNPGCGTCFDPANSNDSNCQQGAYTKENDWGYNLNLRHVHMKAKYGLDPQYPIQRYWIGLTSSAVPDRHGEYENNDGSSTSNYIGRNDCTNPLFAASLPDGSVLDAAHLCNLPPGPRTADQVFYAIIGGVPNELLHFKPGDARASQLSDADWKKILGADPLKYDYNGIDPHMIEDYRDRAQIIAANGYPFTTDPSGTNPLASSDTAPGTPDPVNGREWVTDKDTHPPLPAVDRQYACTFPLAQPRDCTLAENGNSCDCPQSAGGLTPQEYPPICNGTTQIAAKAYPTIRELEVARLMGKQGIVSSLCPIHVTDQTMDGNDPLFGYRPAVAVIIDRLKNALNSQCLGKLTVDPSDHTVPCLVLVTMPPGSAGTCKNPTCDANQGLSVPDPTLLRQFCDQQEKAYADTGAAPGGPEDPATRSVCELQELVKGPAPNGLSSSATVSYVDDFDGTGSCATAQENGWCYVEGIAASKGHCSQAVVFSASSPPSGAIGFLQCIEHSIATVGSSSSSSP